MTSLHPPWTTPTGPSSSIIAIAVESVGSSSSSLPVVADVRDVRAFEAEGLLGSLVALCDAGRIVPDAEAATVVERLGLEAAMRIVAVEARAVTAACLLREHGIECRVLKGLAVAHLDYSTPELRHFADADLLVQGDDLAQVLHLLGQRGFVRRYAEPYPGHDVHFGKGVALRGPDGVEFDLHRTLALGWFGTRLSVDELWSEPDSVVLCGEELAALPRHQRYVHAALHMALAPRRRLAHGIDLFAMASLLSDEGACRVIDTADRWGCAGPVAAATRVASVWLRGAWTNVVLRDWSERYPDPWSQRLAMASYRSPLLRSPVTTLGAVLGLPTWRERRAAVAGRVRGLGRSRG